MLAALKKKTFQTSSLIRSGLYFLESHPLVYLEQWIRYKSLHKPELLISEKELLNEVLNLIQYDSEMYIKHKYPLSFLNIENPLKHSKRLLKIYLDSIEVSYKKKFNKHKEFSNTKPKQDFPDYYLRNFHNQTDGYLSSDSARLYNHQVEILFRGTADIMRRLILPPMLENLSPKAPLDIIESGSGTGVSTKILYSIFKNSHIKAYDLSPYYTSHAKNQFPSPNVSYECGDVEKLPEHSASFDAWCSTFMFHELPHKNRLEVLEEAQRLLKKSGFIFIVDSIQKHDRPDYEKVLTAFPENFHEPFYKNYVQKPIEDDLEKLGFKNIQSTNKFLTKVVWAKRG